MARDYDEFSFAEEDAWAEARDIQSEYQLDDDMVDAYDEYADDEDDWYDDRDYDYEYESDWQAERRELAQTRPFDIVDITRDSYHIQLNGFDSELSAIKNDEFRNSKYYQRYDIEDLGLEVGRGDSEGISLGYVDYYDPSPPGVGLGAGMMSEWVEVGRDYTPLAVSMLEAIDGGGIDYIDEDDLADIGDKLDMYLGNEPHRVADLEAAYDNDCGDDVREYVDTWAVDEFTPDYQSGISLT